MREVRTSIDVQTSLSALPRWSRAAGGTTRLRAKPAGLAARLLGARGSRGRTIMTVRAAPWLRTRAPAAVAWQLLGWPFVVASGFGVLPVQDLPAAAEASMACCLSTARQTAMSTHFSILSRMAEQSKDL